MEKVRNFVGSFHSRQNSGFIKVSRRMGISFFKGAVLGCKLSISVSVLLSRWMLLRHSIFNFFNNYSYLNTSYILF